MCKVLCQTFTSANVVLRGVGHAQVQTFEAFIHWIKIVNMWDKPISKLFRTIKIWPKHTGLSQFTHKVVCPNSTAAVGKCLLKTESLGQATHKGTFRRRVRWPHSHTQTKKVDWLLCESHWADHFCFCQYLINELNLWLLNVERKGIQGSPNSLISIVQVIGIGGICQWAAAQQRTQVVGSYKCLGANTLLTL